MRFVPLGVGDAFSERSYSSCLALQAEGEWLLVDCPHPIRKMMREASETAGVELDIDRIAAICLTHLHADHCSGVEGFAFFSHFVLGRRAHVAGHPDVLDRLWPDRLRAGMDQIVEEWGQPPVRRTFEDYFDRTDLEGEEPVRVGPFSIRCRPTLHHVPTFALRIEAGGRTLGYSADTAFDPGLIQWLTDADLVVHETNVGTHTPYEKLAELPRDLRERMRLIHYPDDFDREGSIIEPLRQGELHQV